MIPVGGEGGVVSGLPPPTYSYAPLSRNDAKHLLLGCPRVRRRDGQLRLCPVKYEQSSYPLYGISQGFVGIESGDALNFISKFIHKRIRAFNQMNCNIIRFLKCPLFYFLRLPFDFIRLEFRAAFEHQIHFPAETGAPEIQV